MHRRQKRGEGDKDVFLVQNADDAAVAGRKDLIAPHDELLRDQAADAGQTEVHLIGTYVTAQAGSVMGDAAAHKNSRENHQHAGGVRAHGGDRRLKIAVGGFAENGLPHAADDRHQ